MKVPAPISQTVSNLEKEEKRLFDTYNRHHSADVKIKHLQALIKVITEIDVAKKMVKEIEVYK